MRLDGDVGGWRVTADRPGRRATVVRRGEIRGEGNEVERKEQRERRWAELQDTKEPIHSASVINKSPAMTERRHIKRGPPHPGSLQVTEPKRWVIGAGGGGGEAAHRGSDKMLSAPCSVS